MKNKTVNFILFFYVFVIFGFFVKPSSISAFNVGDPIDNAYIHQFFDDFAFLSEDERLKQTLKDSASKNPSLLIDFLNEMIQVTADLKDQDFKNPDLTVVEDFIDRWKCSESDCQECIVFLPIFETMLQQYTDALATRTKRPSPPLAHLFQVFQKFSSRDFNGFESLFHMPWITPRKTKLYVIEKSIKSRDFSGQHDYIKKRQVIKIVDSKIVFAEFILRDSLTYFKIAEKQISILHQALEEMKKGNADLRAILLVQHYIGVITRQINMAAASGGLDEFTYQFFNDPQFKKKNLAISRHPLLKPPYSPDEFEVLRYY